jgi:hypothetical protein
MEPIIGSIPRSPRGAGSRAAGLAVIFKLVASA